MKGTRRTALVASIAGPLIVVALASVGTWIAFGPGVRKCAISLSIPFLAQSETPGDWQCRAVFGYGAIVSYALIPLIFAASLISWFGSGRALIAFRRTCQNLLLIALSPVLLLLAIFLLVIAGASGVKDRIRGPAS